MDVEATTAATLATADWYESIQSEGKTFQQVRTSEKGEGRTPMMVYTHSLKEFLCMELSLVPQVERVYASKEGDVMHVYSVVNDFDAAVRSKIYDREAMIIDEFSYLGFDFNIISRRGRDLSEVLAKSDFEFCYERPNV